MFEAYSIVINNSLYPGENVIPGTASSYNIPKSHTVIALGPHLHSQLVSKGVKIDIRASYLLW
jgi:hypothetical protein